MKFIVFNSTKYTLEKLKNNVIYYAKVNCENIFGENLFV